MMLWRVVKAMAATPPGWGFLASIIPVVSLRLTTGYGAGKPPA